MINKKFNYQIQLINVILGLFFLVIVTIPFIRNSGLNSIYIAYNQLNFEIFHSMWLSENFGIFAYNFIPFDIAIWALFKILPAWIASLLAYVIPQYIAIISSYKLSRHIYKNRLLASLSAIFYAYSIYAQFMSGWPIHSGSIVYALLPFYIYKFLKIEKTNLYTTICQIILSTLLLIDVNLTYIAYIFISVFFVCIYRRLSVITLSIENI